MNQNNDNNNNNFLTQFDESLNRLNQLNTAISENTENSRVFTENITVRLASIKQKIIMIIYITVDIVKINLILLINQDGDTKKNVNHLIIESNKFLKRIIKYKKKMIKSKKKQKK